VRPPLVTRWRLADAPLARGAGRASVGSWGAWGAGRGMWGRVGARRASR